MKPALPAFQQIEHTADIGLKIFGNDLPSLYQHAALGLFDIITNVALVDASETINLSVESPDREALLVDWLSELNYIFLTKRILFKDFDVKYVSDLTLEATAAGEPLDLQKHEIYTEVKAVTYHALYVRETPEGFEAQVIFDL